MVVHPQHGLLVYLDATPDEQLRHDSSQALVLTGLVCNQIEGLESLKQFKDTPFEQRAAEARRIVAAMESGVLSLYTVSIVATFAAIERYATAQARFLEGVMRKQGERYVIGGKRIGSNIALSMVWYAVAQNFIGLRAACWAKSMGLKRITLILDSLPGDSSTAMNLVRRVSQESELAQLWVQTIESTGVHFRITNMKSYRAREGDVERPAKEYPHSILVDWISHSLYASFVCNQDAFLDKHTTRTADEKVEYLSAIKAPWFWLYQNKRGPFVSLERLVSSKPEEAGTLDSDTADEIT